MTVREPIPQPLGVPVPAWDRREPPRPVVLDGRHVTLEPIAASHAADLYDALCGVQDEPLWTYRTEPRPAGVGEMAVLIERLDPGTPTWAVVPHGHSRAAGMVSLLQADVDQGSVEVGSIVFAGRLQRTTVATETLHLLMVHVLDSLGYRRLAWKCDSLNEPSRRAALRLGFRYEGRFHHHRVVKGHNRDTDWFSLTSADWPRVRAAHRRWLDPANFDDDGSQRSPLRVSAAPAAEDRVLLGPDDAMAAAPPGWQVEDGRLVARLRTGDFATGLLLVDRIGAVAEHEDHHPDLLLTYGALEVTLVSHDLGGLSLRDVRLAVAVGALAEELGVEL